MTLVARVGNGPNVPVVKHGDAPSVFRQTRVANRTSRVWWLRLNLAAMVISVVPTLFRLLGSYRVNESWHYTASEWLINNAAAVSRRGLIGELLLGVPIVDDRTALVAMITLLTVAVSVGFAMLVARAVRLTNSPWPLVFWLLPGGLVLSTLQATFHGLHIGMTDFRLRRESVFLLIVLAVVLATARWSSRRSWPVIALPAIAALTASVFIHEGFALITSVVVAYHLLWLHPNPPALWQRWPGSPWLRQHSVPTILLLIAPIGVCLGFIMAPALQMGDDLRAIWFAVDPTTREWVREQTVTSGGVDTKVPLAISFLGSDAADGVNWVQQIYFGSRAWVGWLATAAVIFGWVVICAWLVNFRRSNVVWSLATVVGIAGLMLPLYLVAVDWGRWLAFGTLLSSLLILGRLVLPGSQPRPVPLKFPAILAFCVLALTAVAIGRVEFFV